LREEKEQALLHPKSIAKIALKKFFEYQDTHL